MLPHIFNGNGTISIMIDGVMKPIDTAHKNYAEIKQTIIDNNWDLIPTLVNIVDQVQKAIDDASITPDTIKIINGEVLFNNRVLHNSLTSRIVAMAKEGFNIGHMVRFLENLMLNPSYKAVNELYNFLESGSIPITENGTFLAYKKIKNDWTDIHTGTIDNSIGATPKMPRNMVNEDSNQTCSSGLHVCSYDYLPNFGSSGNNRVIICEINPRDVVSIPTDYQNTKMRCCAYTVIGEVENYKQSNTLAQNAVMFTNDVKTGKSYGMVNHTNYETDATYIGKTISAALDNEEYCPEQLAFALKIAGLNTNDAMEIKYIAENSDTKRVGKTIAKHIINNKINIASLIAELESFEDEDEDEDECEYDHFCDRCGVGLYEDEIECPDCGYWNE